MERTMRELSSEFSWIRVKSAETIEFLGLFEVQFLADFVGFCIFSWCLGGFLVLFLGTECFFSFLIFLSPESF